MIKKILLTLLALIVVLVVVGVSLSDRYQCSRSVVVQAPPEKIHPFISDLNLWPQWEPFSAENSNMKTTLGEKTSGVGASQSWDGEGDKGKLTITKSDPKTGVDYDLVFVNGESESLAKAWMHMTSLSGGATEVVWGIDGEMNMPVIGGYFALMADRMMGPMFERGLDKLKSKAEQK